MKVLPSSSPLLVHVGDSETLSGCEIDGQDLHVGCSIGESPHGRSVLVCFRLQPSSNQHGQLLGAGGAIVSSTGPRHLEKQGPPYVIYILARKKIIVLYCNTCN